MRVVTALLATVLLVPVARADEPISWDEADRHVGEEATVEGRVMGVHCSPISCLLAFDPSFNRFTVVIQARSFDTFPPDRLDERFSGRRVLVHGTIRKNDNKPEIEVDKPEDLRIATTKRRGERNDATEGAQQTEVFERMGAVLARVEELTERLATMQERMDTLLAQIEQRSAALAAAQAAAQPGPPPPQPSYGEPQPRPGYEALRTIKRGMSRADVQRLAGQPLTIEGGSGGWSTWYYGYGRSVSFDGRGRVQGLSGFPSP